eukprot:scaffold11068_cov136-Skeletonema_marinoi.AAC.1
MVGELPYSQSEMRYGGRAGSWRTSQVPHQVTYDVVATSIRPINASAVIKMHIVRYDMVGELPYSHSEMRYGGRAGSWRTSQ